MAKMKKPVWTRWDTYEFEDVPKEFSLDKIHGLLSVSEEEGYYKVVDEEGQVLCDGEGLPECNRFVREYNAHLTKPSQIEYRYNEDVLLTEFKQYIDSTYGEHYASDKGQAMDLVLSSGLAKGFCAGNVIKYASRYGKKGHPEDHRKDILKVLHYALFLLHAHDEDTK